MIVFISVSEGGLYRVYVKFVTCSVRGEICVRMENLLVVYKY